MIKSITGMFSGQRRPVEELRDQHLWEKAARNVEADDSQAVAQAELQKALVKAVEIEKGAVAESVLRRDGYIELVEGANSQMQRQIVRIFKTDESGALINTDGHGKIFVGLPWTYTRNVSKNKRRTTHRTASGSVIFAILENRRRKGEKVPFFFDRKLLRWYVTPGVDLVSAMKWAEAHPITVSEWRKHHQPLRDNARLRVQKHRAKNRW